MNLGFVSGQGARLALIAFAASAAPVSLPAAITLPAFFSDGMVLQRDGTAPVWGNAEPGESIRAELAGQKASARADDQGNWRIVFQNLAAGGPYAMAIEGKSGTVTIKNVLVGDVWFCWGDMNMAETLAEQGDAARPDIAGAADPLLHFFTTRPVFPPPDPVHDQPAPDAEGTWVESSPAAAPRFTAYGYYFARELRHALGIPVGIINCSHGGAGIETWMPAEVITAAGFPDIGGRTAQYAALDDLAAKFLAQLTAWETRFGRQDPGNKGFAAGWADPKTDVSAWTPIATPGDWTSVGLTNGGAVWLRKTVELAPGAAGHDLTLHLGDIKNLDHAFGDMLGTVYFNGGKAGDFGRSLKRVYLGSAGTDVGVPGRLVVAGPNVIAIRIFTQAQKNHPFGGGKLIDPALASGAMKENGWTARVESPLPALPAEALASRPEPPYAPPVIRLPGLFYDHMLHPFIGYGIKGVAAYHGESNVHVGEAYRELFPAFIRFWREKWKDDDLPFCFTQIADVYPPRPAPGLSDWAELRESQLLAWEHVPRTGMAVTIDLGDADVHLRRKKDAAQRLAVVALANAYSQKIAAAGPIYASMSSEGNKIRIRFRPAGGVLVAKDGPLRQFSIAGVDQKFVPADAVIDGDTVLVSSGQVPHPAAVRYAWADNAAAGNLYNRDDWPAAGFRTDNWPLHTHGNTARDLLLTDSPAGQAPCSVLRNVSVKEQTQTAALALSGTAAAP
jgi:sialate O-acetylesterase